MAAANTNSFDSAWFLLALQMNKTRVVFDNSSAKARQAGLEKKKIPLDISCMHNALQGSGTGSEVHDDPTQELMPGWPKGCS